MSQFAYQHNHPGTPYWMPSLAIAGQSWALGRPLAISFWAKRLKIRLRNTFVKGSVATTLKIMGGLPTKYQLCHPVPGMITSIPVPAFLQTTIAVIASEARNLLFL